MQKITLSQFRYSAYRVIRSMIGFASSALLHVTSRDGPDLRVSLYNHSAQRHARLARLKWTDANCLSAAGWGRKFDKYGAIAITVDSSAWLVVEDWDATPV